MAYLQSRRNKEGQVVSYSIRVYKGRDPRTGKQLTPYTMTWRVPEGWSEKRARKEAEKQAAVFEKQCREGYLADGRQTFAQYAAYVLELKERTGLKHLTLIHYRQSLKRVLPFLGHLKLGEIRPQHLNYVYQQLSLPEAREDNEMAEARQALWQVAEARGIKNYVNVKEGGRVSLERLRKGELVKPATARRIAQALELPYSLLFATHREERCLSSRTIMNCHLVISIVLARWATAPVEKAWRQQRQFLSDASHELKTPLTVILSNAELLQAAPLSDKPARWSENIRMEAQQMKNLVEEMLTLTRADNMPHTAVLEEVSLSDIAADCALAFEPVAFEAGKPLDYHLAEDVTVLGDRDKLRQLVSVLLDNAIKYGQDGGTITMTLQKTDRHARLIVTNPGEPIPPEQLKRLFERFYRADASRGEKSGFGLGLPIANTIAAEHKGTLKAESDAASTRFIFTMPLKK